MVSGQRVLLALLMIPVFAYPTFRVLSKAGAFDRSRFLLTGLTAIALALLGLQAMFYYPEKTYLFFGQHSLILTSRPSDFEIRGIRTSINDVSFRALDGVDGWEWQGNTLKPTASSPALSWRGWTGDSIRLEVRGSPGSMFQLAWDGRVQEYQFGKDRDKSLVIEEHFSMPAAGNAALFVILWLAIWYFIWHLFPLPEAQWGEISTTLRVLFLIAAAAGWGFLLLKIYLMIHPSLMFPDRDSGFFMYAGRAVLEGKIPYRDFWDHKGPVIYYLNALGLLLGGGSAAGVWGLELVWAGVSSVCLFLLLRELGGELAGWAGVMVFLLGLRDALGGGNFVEEYSLLFTILTLLLFRIFLRSRNVKWLALCGILTGMTFLLRANLISAGLGIFAYLLILAIRDRFSKLRLISLLSFSAGAAAPILMYSLYMAGHHAFSDMVSEMILYNRTYAGPLSLNVLEDFRRGLAGFPWLGFWIVSGLAAVSPGILNRS